MNGRCRYCETNRTNRASLSGMAVDLERLRADLERLRREASADRDAHIEKQIEIETLEEHIRFAETIGDVA